MNSTRQALSISQASDPSRTLWSDFLIFRNAKCDVAVNRASGDFPSHLHEFAEVSFFLSGKASHETEFFSSEVSEGGFSIVVPGERHSYSNASRDFRRLNVQIRRACFEETLETLRDAGLGLELFSGGSHECVKAASSGDLLDPAQFAERLRLALDMEREWLAASPGFAPALKLKLGLLMLSLLRSAASREGFAPPSSRIKAALDLIERDYAKPLTLADLERAVGMERRSLERAFLAETGLSPKGYLMKTRIAWACRLLDKGVRLQEAAAACGFAGQNYFARAFKAATGSTPGRYAALSLGNAALKR